jgi:hypothetical protein
LTHRGWVSPILPQKILLLLSLCASTTFGQTSSFDPPAELRFRMGPLRWKPTATVEQVGIDTNVFNTVDNPKRDFTATMSPQVQFWMRVGKGRLLGTTSLGYVHYQTFSSQRALSTRNQIRAELPLNRLTPYVVESYTNAKERPGYEIDSRARRTENTVTLGADLRVGAKSSVGFSAWRTDVRFDADEVFLGTFLSDVLNRTGDGLRLTLRRRLTPLTTAVIDAEAQRDRFDFTPDRDADSVRVVGGFDFSPMTLITGSGRVGFRKFDPVGFGGRGYRGIVAAADLGYTFQRTRIGLRVDRDITYSFDFANPYYLQTGVGVTATQKITPRWDVQFTASHQQLAYRALASNLSTGRTDRVRIVGGGVGYSPGPGTRLGFSVDTFSRRSDNQSRAYEGVRIGTGVTYGF